MGGWAAIPSGIAVIAAMVASPAYAFDSAQSSPGKAEHLTVEQAAVFSKDIERTLASKGARVALVFRSGRSRDRLPDNVQYTHGAFWVYQDIQRQDGTIMKGYAVYNLYHGDGDSMPKTKSYLAQDFPLDFTIASSVDDIAVIIPDPILQQRIYAIMASDTYEDLHIEDYSLVSNVGDPKYQNCNEFMLDVMAAAIWETDDYAQLKANLGAYFEPTKIKAGPLERFFAPMADERLRMGDQKGKVETVTYSSLVNFLDEYGYLQENFVILRKEDQQSQS